MKAAIDLKAGDIVRLDGEGEPLKVIRVVAQGVFTSAYIEFDSGWRWYFGASNRPSNHIERWEIVSSNVSVPGK